MSSVPTRRAQESVVRVRYAETDRMGMAHHTQHLVWFELGRTDWLREAPSAGGARSYRALEEEGYFLPVVELGTKYHRPARYDDVLVISTRLSDANPVRIAFEYEVSRRDDGDRISSGTTVHAVVGADGRVRRLSREAWTWVVAGEPQSERVRGPRAPDGELLRGRARPRKQHEQSGEDGD